MKYTVTFVQNHTYEVEAESSIVAEGVAYAEFKSDMRKPYVPTWYDDVVVTCDEEDCETCYANDIRYLDSDSPCLRCKENNLEWMSKESEITWDDLTEDLKELVECGLYTKEEAIEKYKFDLKYNT